MPVCSPGCAQKAYSAEQIASIGRVAGKRTDGELSAAAAALIDRWQDKFSLPTPAAIADQLHALTASRADIAPPKPEWQLAREAETKRAQLVAAAMQQFSLTGVAAEAIAGGWWEGKWGLKLWAHNLAANMAAAVTTPKTTLIPLNTAALIPDYHLCGIALVNERKGELGALVREARVRGRVEITVPHWAAEVMKRMAQVRAAKAAEIPAIARPQHPAQAVKQQMEGAGE